MKKNLFCLVIALVLLMGSVSLAQDVVKFGIAEPMTGDMAVGGELCWMGMN